MSGAGANVVLFGSAVMMLHGLRETIGDVDLFVRREAWAELAVRGGWRVQFPTMGDPPLLEWRGGPVVVHAFERWAGRDYWMNVQQAWERRESVQGWPCIPLAMLARWKRDAARYNAGSEAHAKHSRDADVIEKYLGAKHART